MFFFSEAALNLFSLTVIVLASVGVDAATCDGNWVPVPANQIPRTRTCGGYGFLAKPNIAATSTSSTLEDCVASCKAAQAVTFGYSAENQTCVLYSKRLIDMKYRTPKQDFGTVFYNQACFRCQPPPPCSSNLVNGGFEDAGETDTGADGWVGAPAAGVQSSLTFVQPQRLSYGSIGAAPNGGQYYMGATLPANTTSFTAISQTLCLTPGRNYSTVVDVYNGENVFYSLSITGQDPGNSYVCAGLCSGFWFVDTAYTAFTATDRNPVLTVSINQLQPVEDDTYVGVDNVVVSEVQSD